MVEKAIKLGDCVISGNAGHDCKQGIHFPAIPQHEHLIDRSAYLAAGPHRYLFRGSVQDITAYCVTDTPGDHVQCRVADGVPRWKSRQISGTGRVFIQCYGQTLHHRESSPEFCRRRLQEKAHRCWDFRWQFSISWTFVA